MGIARSRRGFTIVELMVVVAIIALLLGLLLPSLAGARRSGRKSSELGALRQIGIAWQMYASANEDTCLPGYISPEVQARWGARYEYPSGVAAPPEIAAFWPWRLMPLIDFNHEMIHGYAHDVDVDISRIGIPSAPGQDDFSGEAGDVACHPAFGYNAHYVGGWWERVDGEVTRYTHRFQDAISDRDGDGTIGDDELTRVVARRAGQITRADQLITFCSSGQFEPGTITDEVRVDHKGFHWVSPFKLAEEMQWRVADPNRTDTVLEAVTENPCPIGRYNGFASVLHADGHTDTAIPGSLADQRKFIDVADRIDFEHSTRGQ